MTIPSFFKPPDTGRYVLRGVRVPACLAEGTDPFETTAEGLVELDIAIEHGRFAAVMRAGAADPASGPDLGRSLVLPGLVDCHAHLDKGHIAPRAPNPTGDMAGAVAATAADRAARWSAEDVRRRMEFGLRTAYAKGVVAIRTHLDSALAQARITYPVFRSLREAWGSRVDLQMSSIAPLDMFLTEEGAILADMVADLGGNLGSGSRFRDLLNDPIPPEYDQAMGHLFDLAAERGLDVDLHVDETSDLSALTLIRVARLARIKNFKGRILCGHCSSLALQSDDVIAETLAACREAGIDIVSLPTANLYLQDRAPGRTPRWRGVTVLHEMRAAGLRVAIGGDNVRDPFFAYGDHDMLETFGQAVRILHLDHPFGDWIASCASVPAAIMGLEGRGRIAAGASADLIVLRARSYSEMLSRTQWNRTVIRTGRAIDTTLPEYRELDDILVPT